MSMAGGAVSGLFKAISGISERNRALGALKNMSAPDYTESGAFSTAERSVGESRRFMESGVPDSIAERNRDGIDRSTAAGLQQAGRTGASIGSVARSATDAYGKMAAMEGDFMLRQRSQYMSSLDKLMAAQDKAYDVDLGEFKTEQAIQLGMVKAGRESLNSGIQDLFSAAALGVEGGLFEGK